MGGMLTAKAIIPKRYTDAARAKGSMDKLLLACKEESFVLLQRYPPWSPWKNSPRTGIRAGGKRTGGLGRNWNSYTLKSGQSIEMTNATKYAPYVQGNSRTQQARALFARGWLPIDTVGKVAVRRAIAKTKLDA